MNKTTYIILAIIVILIAGGILVYRKSPESNLPQPALEVTIPETGAYSPQPSPQPAPQPIEEPKNTNNDEQATNVDEEMPHPPQYTITYSDTGYSPESISIKEGDSVIFKNESSQAMWPASAMHPTHTVYSETSLEDHCPDMANTAFDACKGIPAGGSWSFTFNKVGSWKYHDHLNPSHFGTIIVK